MADENIGLLLKLILDKASQSQTIAGLKLTAKEVEALGKTVGEMSSKDFEHLGSVIDKVDDKLQSFNDELSDTKKRVSDLKGVSAAIGDISRNLLVTGSAIVGSIYLSANKEAQRIKEAGGVVDKTTQKWLDSQQRIQLSYQRIGRTAMTAFLPLLEKAAALAEKGSKFVEKHPDLVKAALNTGAILATIGAVGMLVSKGIRFFADVTLIGAQVKYAASTAIFNSAVDKFLAGIGRGSLGSSTAGSAGGAGRVGATLGAVTLIATSVIIGAELGKIIGNAIAKLIYGKDYKEQGLGDAALTASRIFRLPAKGASAGLDALGLDAASKGLDNLTMQADDLTKKLLGLSPAADDANEALDELGGNLEDEAKGMKILADLAEDEAKALRQNKDDIDKINIDANRSLEDASRDYAKTLNEIPKKLKSSIRDIRSGLKSTLADRASNFAKANADADRELKSQQEETAREGAESIQKIHEQNNKELEALEKEHLQTLAGFIDERDALAIYNENKAYEEKKDALAEDTNDQLEEARKNTQKQLQEQKNNYEEQRKQRAIDYAAQQTEAKAKAAQQITEAKARAEEEKKQAAEQYAEQQTEIERRKQEQLTDLKRSFDNEQRERVLAANNQIKELGGALNAEAQLRRQYYAIMLNDTNNYMSSQAAANRAIASGGAVATGTATFTKVSGSRDIGGYTGNGLYQMHNNDFVASPSTTRALESLIGGRLSQQSLLGAVRNGGGKSSVTWNDQRRFYGAISPAERRLNTEDTAEVLLGGLDG